MIPPALRLAEFRTGAGFHSEAALAVRMVVLLLTGLLVLPAVPQLHATDSQLVPAAGKDKLGTAAIREVFPVPEVVRHMFAGRGVEAFNPFYAWGPHSGSPELPDSPIKPVPEAEAALLPPGQVYDVVPVWERMGLRPRADTRVLYHAASGLLFARIAPEDVERVRDLCSWPLKVQASSFYDRAAPDYSYQPQLAVSTWLVPVSGAGGWNFQPRTPEELMALPVSARTLAGRQRITARSGQNCVIREQRQLPDDRENAVGGLRMEAQVLRGDNGITYDVNAGITLTRRLDSSGRVTELSGASQRLARLGDSWLVEAGMLPENPPVRVFHILSLPEKPVIPADLEPLSKMEARWIGKSPAVPARRAEPAAENAAPDGGTAFLVADGNFIHTFVETARKAKASPTGTGTTDPAESSAKPEDETDSGSTARVQDWRDPWEGATSVRIPEWFGDEEMQDISALVAEAFHQAAGAVQAWRWEDLVLIKGDPAAVGFIRRAGEHFLNPEPAANPLLEAVLSLRPDGVPLPAPAAGAALDSLRSVTGDIVLARVLVPVKENGEYDFTLRDRISAPGQAEPDETTLGKLTLTLARADNSAPVPTNRVAAALERAAADVQVTAGSPASSHSASASSATFVATVTLSLAPPLTKTPLQAAFRIPMAGTEFSTAEVARRPGGGTLMLSMRACPAPVPPPLPETRETLREFWWRKTAGTPATIFPAAGN